MQTAPADHLGAGSPEARWITLFRTAFTLTIKGSVAPTSEPHQHTHAQQQKNTHGNFFLSATSLLGRLNENVSVRYLSRSPLTFPLLGEIFWKKKALRREIKPSPWDSFVKFIIIKFFSFSSFIRMCRLMIFRDADFERTQRHKRNDLKWNKKFKNKTERKSNENRERYSRGWPGGGVQGAHRERERAPGKTHHLRLQSASGGRGAIRKRPEALASSSPRRKHSNDTQLKSLAPQLVAD